MRMPPSLAPFGLVLHHDGKWSHEGQPILNRRLREKFDRSVVYLPNLEKYVVEVGRFKGEIEVEEAAFFVRSVDLLKGKLRISDGTTVEFDASSLHWSKFDGARLCRIERSGSQRSVLARFDHSAHSELLLSINEREEMLTLRVGGTLIVLGGLRNS